MNVGYDHDYHRPYRDNSAQINWLVIILLVIYHLRLSDAVKPFDDDYKWSFTNSSYCFEIFFIVMEQWTMWMMERQNKKKTKKDKTGKWHANVQYTITSQWPRQIVVSGPTVCMDHS